MKDWLSFEMGILRLLDRESFAMFGLLNAFLQYALHLDREHPAETRQTEKGLLPPHQVRKRMYLHAAAGIGVSVYVFPFVIPSRDKQTPNYLPVAFQAHIHLPC